MFKKNLAAGVCLSALAVFSTSAFAASCEVEGYVTEVKYNGVGEISSILMKSDLSQQYSDSGAHVNEKHVALISAAVNSFYHDKKIKITSNVNCINWAGKTYINSPFGDRDQEKLNFEFNSH